MPLVITAVCGAAGFLLSHVYLQRLEAEASGGPRVSIVIAAEDLAVGTTLSEAQLAVRDLPNAYIERRHVLASDVEKVLGTRIGVALEAAQALLWTDLSDLGERPRFLSALVQNGMRAFVVDEQSADFGGLLRPGDRVDVLFTTSGSDKASRTSTLLQNLLVLAVGGDFGAFADSARPRQRQAASVALSTTLEQAQLLTQARELGRLSFTLRNPADIALIDGIVETKSEDVALLSERAGFRGPSPERVIEHVR